MLPESALYSLRHYIRSCSLKVVTINCRHVALVLLNLRSGAMVISQSSMGSGRTGLTARMSGGSMAPSTMSTLTSSSSTRRSGAVPVAGGKRKNPEPIQNSMSLMHDLRTQQPGTDIHALFRSEKLLISDIGVGGRGTCLDFTYIGECTRLGCTFNRSRPMSLRANVETAIKKMTKAVAGYLEHNPTTA
jgi:hypothetical protein